MRVTQQSPNALKGAAQAQEASSLSGAQLGKLFGDVDLNLFPADTGLCALLGKAAAALASLFSSAPPETTGDDDGPASIVDFGHQTDDAASIVDFGDQKRRVDTSGLSSIVDFGEKDPLA